MKVGVIGVGSMGRNHARVIAASPNCELAGVSDVDFDRAVAAGLEFSTPICQYVTNLVSACDAVVIASPPKCHYSMAAYARKNCHALVEKPLCLDSGEVDLLRREYQKAGKVLAVGHVERFNPCVQWAKQHAGELSYLEFERTCTQKERGRDVSVVMDLMIHDIDLALHITGKEWACVYASGNENRAEAHLTLADGTSCDFIADREHHANLRTISAEAGFNKLVNLNLATQEGCTYEDQFNRVERKFLQLNKQNALAMQLEEFILVCNGEKPATIATGKDGLEAVRIAEEIERQLGIK